MSDQPVIRAVSLFEEPNTTGINTTCDIGVVPNPLMSHHGIRARETRSVHSIYYQREPRTGNGFRIEDIGELDDTERWLAPYPGLPASPVLDGFHIHCGVLDILEGRVKVNQVVVWYVDDGTLRQIPKNSYIQRVLMAEEWKPDPVISYRVHVTGTDLAHLGDDKGQVMLKQIVLKAR